MTKRELINHLESLAVPDDAEVLIETTSDYGDSTEFCEWDMPTASEDAYQSPVIVIGDVETFNRQVQSTIDYESREFRPELESEAAARLRREDQERTRRYASARNLSGRSIIEAYQGDVTRRITEKVFASYIK